MPRHQKPRPNEKTRARLEEEAVVAKSSTDDIIVDGELCHALIAEVGCGIGDFSRFIGMRPETMSRMLGDAEMRARHPLVKRLVRQLVLVVNLSPAIARRAIAHDDRFVGTGMLFGASDTWEQPQ